MIKQNNILILMVFSFLLSCNPKTSTILDQPIPDVEGEIYTGDDPSIDRNMDDTIRTDPFPEGKSDIVEASLHDLKLIEETWNQTVVYTDTSMEFLLVRPTSAKTAVAIATAYPNLEDFFFYELDLEGRIISKTQLYSTNHSCNLSQNLQEINGSIHYFKMKNLEEEWVYDLKTKTHTLTKNQQLDWTAIKDWKKQGSYTSPDSTKTIRLQTTSLSLLSDNKEKQLIKQLYDGNWSFGSGCWSTNGNTFFFDNSGATACIWKIDLIAKTLAKVVPEHEAKAPVSFEHDNETKLIYCEGSCIKMAGR